MVGFSDVSHCGPCSACVECIVGIITDLDQDCTSGFTIVSGELHTTVDAFIYTLKTMTDPWYVKVNFTIIFNSGHADWLTQPSSSTVRIHGGLDDCNSYWFVDITYYTYLVSGSSTGRAIKLEMGINDNGLEVIYSKHPHDGAGHQFVGSDWEYPDSTVTAEWGICWDGSSLRLLPSTSLLGGGPGQPNGFAADAYLQLNNLTSPFGDMSGVSAVLDTKTTRVEINGFWYGSITGTWDTAGCDSCHLNCCQGVYPPEITVEISHSSTTFTTTNCPGPINCTSLVGTFTLTYLQWFNTTLAEGDAFCEWAVEFDSPTGQICNGVVARFRIRMSLLALTYSAGEWDAGLRKVRIQVEHINGGFGNPNILAEFSTTTYLPCEDWDDWITAPKNTTLLNSQCNNSSTISAQFKKAA